MNSMAQISTQQSAFIIQQFALGLSAECKQTPGVAKCQMPRAEC